MAKRSILFLTGTRADFGKLKSLMESVEAAPQFDLHVFATGMHLRQQYGRTVDEIHKCGFKRVFTYMNFGPEPAMDLDLARTITGLSTYVHEYPQDLIVIHGDRVEALAGATVGALNNIRVAHIEGGEVSGTVDEMIRHAVSKLSHIHLVANDEAKRRLLQMGELEESIFVIGSPDIDLMLSDRLPELAEVQAHYDIPFRTFGLVMFHPVTTEAEEFPQYAKQFFAAVRANPQFNYVVVYPNNDRGSAAIIAEIEQLRGAPNVRIYPSIRFEYFLTLLKNAQFIAGNSSAGIREAPIYQVPTVNVGTRQNNRALHGHILNTGYGTAEISAALQAATDTLVPKSPEHFGAGDSYRRFLDLLHAETFWKLPMQKFFRDYAFDY